MQNQIELAKRDASKTVSKGSDLGLAGYTRVYLYVGGSILLFIYVANKLSTYLDMTDPLQGTLFTGGLIYGFYRLCKEFDK